MQNKQFDNPEHWAGEVLGDAITGGYYTLARNVSLVLTKILAAIGLVLLRHRFGKHFITLGTLFWSGGLVGILYLLAGVSASLYLGLLGILTTLGLYHIWEARRNLRRGRPEAARHSLDWGTSLFWPLYVRLLYRMKLENSFLGNLTEFGFQKWIEPALLGLIGLVFLALGFDGFGFLLLLSSGSIFKLALFVQRDYYNMKQRMIDAGQGSQMMETMQETPTQPANRVMARPIRRG